MASSAATAPSKAQASLQIAAAWSGAWERWLEAERHQLVLWLPIMLGAGIATWFVLPDATGWTAALLGSAGIAGSALALARGGRCGVTIAAGAIAFAIGLALVWWRAEAVRAPVLARPAIVELVGRVTRVQAQPARDLTRVWIAVERWDGQVRDDVPRRVRVNVADDDLPTGVVEQSRVRVRARLMPPAPPAVPGAYDFARVAWFEGLGATGRAIDIAVIARAGSDREGIRARLTRHIEAQLPGSAGGIAAALATGDTGAIADEDAEAMRRAGLAHLLSVSGLHITAAVGIVMALALRLLALSPRLALTGRVPLLAGGAAALAAIGYTWLTGAEVPTIRSCVAALLVLAALAMGREAVTLRLVAAGALIVLVAWPQALVSASFQLSFAAVTAIVALHEHPRARALFLSREEAWWRRGLREGGSLLTTGLLVELALMPIAVFHFHKAGVYGAFANIVAIPLTTFVVMPVEAGALMLDAVRLGAPLWWVAGQTLRLLLWIAHAVASAPGSVAALPAMPRGAFALMIAGGLWVALWRTRARWAGLVPVFVGACWTIATPTPDLIVTGDGRHLAWRGEDGSLALLRDRAGDYTRDTLAENGGFDGEMAALSETRSARCNQDLCWATRQIGERRVTLLATRSGYLVPAGAFIDLCRRVDIVVSERRVPRRCRARWLTLDRASLRRTGGVAVSFEDASITTVRVAKDAHPWITRSGGEYRPAYPERAPARGRNAADHRRGWRDRAAPSHLRDGNI
ncbi:competence protein ComEC [Sphingomonas palmae]|uniref:Competence protein ComEC n=1 Tax=Sphingomonas palmae TaxID=1855283 RepID=A0A1H7ILE6_9SPHN|nr:competence protein ComEC [Sphingomonas palmae]